MIITLPASGTTVSLNEKKRSTAQATDLETCTPLPGSKTINDLPAPPDTLKVLTQLVCYKMFGLSTIYAAQAIGRTEQQVNEMLESVAYNTFVKSISKNVLESQDIDAKDKFKRLATIATSRMEELLDSDDEKTVLAASKDVLDRAGLRPADTTESSMNMMAALRIEIIQRDATVTLQGN